MKDVKAILYGDMFPIILTWKDTEKNLFPETRSELSLTLQLNAPINAIVGV